MLCHVRLGFHGNFAANIIIADGLGVIKKMLSNRVLAKICGFGTFGIVGVVLFVHEEIQGRIRKSECYIEAFKHLHENNGAVKYFGQPMQAGHVNNIYDTEDQSDSVLWYKVPLKGPDGRGSLYYKAVKEQNWFLQKVEVELDKLPGKKFVIMEKNESKNEEGNEISDATENDMEKNESKNEEGNEITDATENDTTEDI